MAIAVSADKTAYGYLDTVTISITGAANNTPYIVTVGTTTVAKLYVTTDGSGAATAKYVHQSSKVSPIPISVRPAGEHNGTTTAAASITTTGA